MGWRAAKEEWGSEQGEYIEGRASGGNAEGGASGGSEWRGDSPHRDRGKLIMPWSCEALMR